MATQITRKGFVNKNGEKVVLQSAPISAPVDNLLKVDPHGQIVDAGFKTSDFARFELYGVVENLNKKFSYPVQYLYDQSRGGSMVYVRGSGSSVVYKFGDFSFTYIKDTDDGRVVKETINGTDFNEFASKMPTGVNILLHMAVYDSSSTSSKTTLPAIFLKYPTTPGSARLYVGNIIFRFGQTSGNYTVNDGYTESVGTLYDLSHILSGDNYTTGYKRIGESPIVSLQNSSDTFEINHELVTKLRVGDIVELSGDDSDYDTKRKVKSVNVPLQTVTFDYVDDSDQQQDMVPQELLSQNLDTEDENTQNITFYSVVRTSAYRLLGEKADRSDLLDALTKIDVLERKVAALEAASA